jgi:hypothetical protein
MNRAIRRKPDIEADTASRNDVTADEKRAAMLKDPAAWRAKIKPASDELIENLELGPFAKPTDDILAQVRHNRPFADPLAPEIDRGGDTEDLLNGLIAECHYWMREVVMPTACRTHDANVRRDFVNTAMEFAVTGARVGEAVAKLRSAGQVTELRQRHVVEHVERVLPPPAPSGENA